MDTMAELAAKNLDRMTQANPANLTHKPAAERRRIPLTNATRKLEVEGIPGYHLQWMNGSARVEAALRAGFEFVSPEEVNLNSVDLGGDRMKDGNTDMGSRVSVSAGGDAEADGQPGRMYLMKQKEEFYLEDQKANRARNDSVVDALTANFGAGRIGVGAAGAPPETREDIENRYVDHARTKIPDLFRRKR